MKKFLILFSFLFVGMVFANTLTKNLSYSLSDASRFDTLSVEFINGKGVVKGTKENSVKVKVKVNIKSDDDSACQEVYDKLKLNVKTSGDEIDLSLNYDDLKKYLNSEISFFNLFCSHRKKVEMSVDVEIFIPSRFSIEFSGVNFDIKAEELKKVKISSVNGAIGAKNIGKVECESVNGNIVLKDIIYKVECEVVNGNLTLETNSEKLSSVSFESVNGNTKIRVPFNVIGDVETDSLTSKATLVLKGKKIVGKNLEWQGDGNCDIDVETVNGKIFIEGF